MTTHNPKFRGTPGPWRVDGHEHKNGVVEYTIVSISGDAVGCAPVAEVLRNNPRPMPEQRIEANARLLAAAPDLLAVLEIIVGIFEPNKLTPYRSARETVDLAKQIIGYVYRAKPPNQRIALKRRRIPRMAVRPTGRHPRRKSEYGLYAEPQLYNRKITVIMKTVEDLNRLIRDEITAIEALRSEDEKIWSVRGGGTEANAKRSKKIRRMIGDHNNEIAHLRRLIRFVEATPEEGIRMMLDQLRGQVDRITASADRYKLKEQKKEYLTRAGAQLKHTQIAELEFLLQ